MEIDTSQRGPQQGAGTPQSRAPEVAVDASEFDKVQAGESPHGNPHGGNGSASEADPSLEVARASGDAPVATQSSEDITETNFPVDGITTPSSTAAVDAAMLRDSSIPIARRLVLPKLAIDDRIPRLLLSGLLAVLLWFYVINLENPTQVTQFTNLSVSVHGLGGQLKVTNTIPPVDVSVQAPQNILGKLGQSDVNPYVDVTGLKEGVHILPVQANIPADKAGDVSVNFSPPTLEVQLELQETKTFTVTVQTQGTPALGNGLEPAQVTPAEVTVTGSRANVDRVTKVVVFVDVDGKSGTQQGLRPPVALDSNGQEVKGLTFDPASVQVVVPIKLLLNYKQVPVRVQIVGQPAAGYRISSFSPDPTNVTLCCTPSALESVDFIPTQPVAITGATTTVVTTTVLLLPPNVQVYPGQPTAVTVTVNVEVLQTTLQLSVIPTVQGTLPGYGSVVSPNKLEMTLSGTFSQLQGLSPADVRAVVDASGKGAGTYSLTPQISVPQGVKLVSSVPDQVTVTLIAPTPAPTETPVPIPTETTTATRVASPTVSSTTTPNEAPTTTHTPAPTATQTATATRTSQSATPTVTATATVTDTATATPAPAPTRAADVQVTPTATP